MRCPSCGAISDSSECCAGGHAETGFEGYENGVVSSSQAEMSQSTQGSSQKRTRSTLIEFPGVSRNSIPEWRKELSERVREVQERRAREATRETTETAETNRQETQDGSAPPQLELLPPAEVPAINPLVAAALKRIE